MDKTYEILEQIVRLLETTENITPTTPAGDCEASHIVEVDGTEYRIIVRKEK